jgi:hypothetical protein
LRQWYAACNARQHRPRPSSPDLNITQGKEPSVDSQE